MPIPAGAGTAYWARGTLIRVVERHEARRCDCEPAVSSARGDASESGDACLAEAGTRQEGGECGAQSRAPPRVAMELTSILAAICAIGEATYAR